MGSAPAGGNPRPRLLIVEGDERTQGALRRWLGELEVDSVFRETDALDQVRAALAAGRPYAIAFVGSVDAATRLWREDPAVHVVVPGTGEMDPGDSDRVVIVRTPIAPAEL